MFYTTNSKYHIDNKNNPRDFYVTKTIVSYDK